MEWPVENERTDPVQNKRENGEQRRLAPVSLHGALEQQQPGGLYEARASESKAQQSADDIPLAKESPNEGMVSYTWSGPCGYNKGRAEAELGR